MCKNCLGKINEAGINIVNYYIIFTTNNIILNFTECNITFFVMFKLGN